MQDAIERIRYWLEGKKTYIVAAAGIIGVIVAWIGKDVSTVEAIQSIVGAILAATIRAGIAKGRE